MTDIKPLPIDSPFEAAWPTPRHADGDFDALPWTGLAGAAASVAILAAAAWQFGGLDLVGVQRLFPTDPLFWTVFACCYLAAPASEWLIYRRLWCLPARGIEALLRKLVSNEILLGYVGEVAFYAWVRRHVRPAASPFGAIKDVAILSAMAGNAWALLLVLVTLPFRGALGLPVLSNAWIGSAAVILASSLAVALLRGRLFALPAADLRFALGAHAGRIVVTTLLAAVMWHLLLPTVAMATWLALGTLRQLVSRLPLVPGKEVVFAGAVAAMTGPGSDVAAAMALMATLTLAAHVLVGAALALRGLIEEMER